MSLMTGKHSFRLLPLSAFDDTLTLNLRLSSLNYKVKAKNPLKPERRSKFLSFSINIKRKLFSNEIKLRKKIRRGENIFLQIPTSSLSESIKKR